MSPKTFTQQGHLLKIEGLVTDVTPVRSPGRAEPDNVEMIDIVLPIQVIVVVGGPLCDVGIPSRALITLLRVI